MRLAIVFSRLPFTANPLVLRHAHILLPCTLRQTLKYLSQTPCSRQRPETVKEFLTTMMHHKLTKSVDSHKAICAVGPCLIYHLCFVAIFHHQGRKASTAEPQAADCSGNSAGECDTLPKLPGNIAHICGCFISTFIETVLFVNFYIVRLWDSCEDSEYAFFYICWALVAKFFRHKFQLKLKNLRISCIS